jgi:hypothetical protein
MKFVDTAANPDHRFSIGRELESGRYYLAIPVSNRLCDYEEYYEITRSTHDAYPGNLAELAALASCCRARMCDDLLLVPPGSDRGFG